MINAHSVYNVRAKKVRRKILSPDNSTPPPTSRSICTSTSKNKLGLEQSFSTGPQKDPRDPLNIPGFQQTKFNNLGVVRETISLQNNF